MSGKWKWGPALSASAFLLASTAHAADAPLFSKGKVVIDVFGADLPFGETVPIYQGYVGPLTLYSQHTESSYPARTTTTQSDYGVEPSLDYFVGDHLSVGGRAGFVWSEVHAYDTSVTFAPMHSNMHGFFLEVAPRVGYAIPFTPTFGFWPRVSGGVLGERMASNGGSKTSTVGEFVQGNFALVARLAPHVLLELGPTLAYRTITSADSPFMHLELTARSSFRVDF